MAFNMWLPLTLLLLAGIVSADYDHGWKEGTEYTYLVRSRTLTSLNKLSDQHSGILLKALLTIQVQNPNLLTAKVWNGQYARIHKSLPKGWQENISDQALQLLDLPFSTKSFEIELKHGVIRNIIVDKDIPTWEVNILKSIVSQLQVDSQGENMIESKDVQLPSNAQPYGSFKSMEDSVSGKCECLYDITPLPDSMAHARPELVPLPELKGHGQYLDITKTKNFKNCDQRMNYHFGITGSNNWEPGSNDNGKFLSTSSTSSIVISGDLRNFTIHSSVTTSKMLISPRFFDNQNGMVVSRMNLTLANVKKISKPLPPVRNPEPIGNLVYTFDNPFSTFNERRVTKWSQDKQGNNILTSDSISSVSSSEEAPAKGEKNLRSFSSGSSASSSSFSDSNENDFWQPTPTLEDAPQNPLMPNFIGFNGKFIGQSDEVDVLKASEELVSQIANELEDPSSIPTQETLEKFTILCSLIRTMSRKQIAQIESNIQLLQGDLKTQDKTQAVKQNAWAVFRDAVTQAGTGPAFLTIKNWIMNRDIGTLQAADILSRISKAARTPTAEYINAFFKLTTSPEVSKEAFLNSTAVIAFAELVRHSQVNTRSLHNRYPVHTFGRLTPKHHQSVTEEYIPYLARQLKSAIEKGESSKIQTLIMALGIIGHPKVASVFEPYLKGEQPITVFQKTLMVSALSKLAESNPKLTRSILYKIYLNTMESHEVRCTAVFLLMKTNPPLSMLQRMAKFTNYDTSKHVNSAVKSTLESLSSLTDPQWKDLAKKASIAKELLTNNGYSFDYSHGFISETVNKDQNMISQMVLNYVGSNENAIPHALYLGWFSSYGDFKTPPTELVAMLSSMTPLIDLVIDRESSSKKWIAEKIVEQLNIIPDQPVPLEGNFMWTTKFSSRFTPLDVNLLSILPQTIMNQLLTAKDKQYINLNKLTSYDVTLGLPTETGLPFVFTFRVPTISKISGTGSVNMPSKLDVKLQSNLRMVYSQKIQGRIGFVAPFEHRHFIAGIDVNFQAFAPLETSMKISYTDGNMQLDIRPQKGEEKSRMLHYSVRPYTTQHDILNLRPIVTDKETQLVLVQPVKSVQSKDDGGMVKIVITADESDEKIWDVDVDTVAGFFASPWTADVDKYRTVDVFMDVEHGKEQLLSLNVNYDSLDVAPGDENSQQWTSEAQAVEPSDKFSFASRKKQMLQQAARGIKSAKAEVLDVQLKITGDEKWQSVATVAWSSSNVETKGRTLLYFNLDGPSKEFKMEICGAAQTEMQPNTPLRYDQAIQSEPKAELNVDVRFGESCSAGERISVKGTAVQSDQLKSRIRKLPLAKVCQLEMTHGNRFLKACRNAVAIAMMMDEVGVSIDVHSKTMPDIVNQMLDLLGNSDILDARVDSTNPKNAGKHKVDINTKLSNSMDKVDVAIHSPSMDVYVDNVDLDMLGLDAEDLLMGTDVDMALGNLIFAQNERSCVLDNTRTETFDGKEYPMRLGNCWHVVMTTIPKFSSYNHDKKLPIPQSSRVSILSRDTEDGRKEVKIMLGDDQIQLLPGAILPQVIVNEQKVTVDESHSYKMVKDDEVVVEIFKVDENAVQVVSEKFDVNLVFDGKRLMIKASRKYYGSVRGLCGNFDGNSANDFTGPKSCILRKPELFVASYALTKGQCEGESLQNSKLIQTHDCVAQASHNQIDGDDGYARFSPWGYHRQGKDEVGGKRCSRHRIQVLDLDDKICFSTRPVLDCMDGCSATEVKSKKYPYHCMERNEAALSLKKRIEKGANPDLSQKPVSMSRMIEIPVACM